MGSFSFFCLVTDHSLTPNDTIQINTSYFTNVKINVLFLCYKTSAFIASSGKTADLFGSFILYSNTVLRTGTGIVDLRALQE